MKILSVLFAFMLWIIVVIVNDPYKTETISGVPITIVNEEEITGQGIGQIYSVLSPQNSTVSIKVYGQRSKVDKLKASDIQAVVDFGEISSVGAAYITVAEPEGITILGKTPEMMKIEIEPLEERTFEVKTNILGKVADGFIVESRTTNPKVITITGPQSIMQKLARAQVQIDVSGSTDDITETAKIGLYDASGKIVDYEREPNIKISEKTAIVSVETLMTKDVEIEIETTGKVDENYRFTGMTQSTNTVKLKGHKDVLSEVDKIVVTKESAVVDLSNLTDSRDVLADISEFLPEGVEFVNKDDRFITVSLTVEPIVERSITIPFEDINILNLADDLEIVFGGDTYMDFDVKIKGLEEDIKTVTVDVLKPYINMTGSSPGVSEYRVYMFAPADVVLEGTVNIRVEVEKIPKPVIEPEVTPVDPTVPTEQTVPEVMAGT
ncbi:MAG: hypothetical protein J6B39_01950 [Lachnospiraceae bacterium]|nr:hypothetical protein [Lachnospiraceae bacterium]